jgi:hypothetical protein
MTILGSELTLVMMQSPLSIVLEPKHRFQANAVHVPSGLAPYFVVKSCKFGEHEIVYGDCPAESFIHLLPHLDVVDRTCPEGNKITLEVFNAASQAQIFSIAFGGWDG